MKPATLIFFAAASLGLQIVAAGGQDVATIHQGGSQGGPAKLIESGQISVDGKSAPYTIHYLPVSSFPTLPDAVQDQVNQRGCLIPQTYEAHRPENVVHASLKGRGTSDWAILCSVKGAVSLLVFFDDGAKPPVVLASAPETERLQSHDPTGVLGFNWGIDPASPRQVREAQAGMEHRPPPLDHDALADILVDHHTIYHFYLGNAWILLDTQD
jgi:hypothetical protein